MGADQTPLDVEAIRARLDAALAHIRECMHIGLQDAKLYDEAGRKRIGEWADFIDKQIRAALAASEMPRPPAQEGRGDAETLDAGSGRGTGVAEADGAQAELSLIPADLITSDPGIRGGEPCIDGTRIPASEVAGYLADGATWDEIREMLPSLPSPPVPSTEGEPDV